MNRFRSIMIGAILGLGVLTALLFANVRSREPAQDGKPLSYWADHLAGSEFGRSYDAIRAIGPRAVAPLLAKVRAIHSVRHRVYNSAWTKLPLHLRRHLSAPKQPDDLDQKVIKALSLLTEDEAPLLVAAFHDHHPDVRRVAALAIGRMLLTEAVTSQSVPGLARLLADPDRAVALAALDTLERMGPDAVPAVPGLIAAIQDPSRDRVAASGVRFRILALRVLGQIGPAAQEAAPELSTLLINADGDLRSQAAVALWRIKRDTNLVDVLTAELERTGKLPAPEILIALGEMGPVAKGAVPALLQKLKDPQADPFNDAGRDLAFNALLRIDRAAAESIRRQQEERSLTDYVRRQLAAQWTLREQHRVDQRTRLPPDPATNRPPLTSP